MAENINWDEATSSGNFVSLKSDTQKVLKITNWRAEKRPMDAKVAAGEIEFLADCVEEDGVVCDKVFSTTSNRLKKKLRAILETKQPTSIVKLSILRVGEQFNTQYSVKEL